MNSQPCCEQDHHLYDEEEEEGAFAGAIFEQLWPSSQQQFMDQLYPGLPYSTAATAVKSAKYELFIDGSHDDRVKARGAVKLFWRPQGSQQQAFKEAATYIPAGSSSGFRTATVFSKVPIEWYCSVQDSRAGGGFADLHASNGALFAAPAPGAYKARQGGSAERWAAASKGPIMLVLDIDGTLYDEHNNTAMVKFANDLKSSSALLGSQLVLCTGRSKGQVASLLAQHPELPLVSFVAEAVGTKIWRRLAGRSGHSESDWEELEHYRKFLDDGSWDVAAARAAAVKVARSFGNDRAICAMQDDGTEHPHRISLCMRHEKVAAAVDSIRADLERAGVHHQIIISGCSSHRHLDILPVRGGKEAATQYLRRLMGLPNSRVVAAGDSGNDISMLAGPHPAIVVGNAQPDLAAWAQQQQHGGQLHATLYSARQGYAAGIAEGLAHFGLM